MAKRKAKQLVRPIGGKKFKTIPFLLLIVGILWLLKDLQVITIDIPWLPIALIIFSIGILMHHKKF